MALKSQNIFFAVEVCDNVFYALKVKVVIVLGKASA